MTRRQPIFWTIVLAALALWLWHPALSPVHVEGFSASIESIARHLLGGDLANFDRTYPFDIEFFTLSRAGMNLATAASTVLVGGSSALGLRVLMISAFVLLVVSSAVVVRRWTGAPIGLIALVLLLLPGLGESGFFYNDNVLSAGLAVAALALVASYGGIGASIGAGLLFGAAVLTRTDAALMSPALALVLLQRHGFGLALLLRLGTGGIIAAAVVLGGLAGIGVTPLDVLRATTYSLRLWAGGQSDAEQLIQAALFVSLPVGALMIGGLIKTIRTRDGLRIALLIGVPAFMLIIYWGKLWQARQFLLLTPFVTTLAIEALVSLRRQTASRSVLTTSWLAVLAVVLFWPSAIWFTDGPRSLTGRLWSPLVWEQWQGSVAKNFAALDAAIADAPIGTSVLITDDWDADRYLHLSLLSAGFTIKNEALPPACTGSVEPFTSNGRTVLHVRLHLPFLPEGLAALPALYEGNAAGCLAALPTAPVHYVANAAELTDWRPGAQSVPTAETKIFPWLVAPAYLALTVVDMDNEKLAALEGFYERVAASRLSGKAVIDAPALAAIISRLAAQTTLLKAH